MFEQNTESVSSMLMTESAVLVACCKGNRTGRLSACVEGSASCIVNWAQGTGVGHAWLRRLVHRLSLLALGFNHTPLYICGGQSDIGAGFCAGASVFPSQ